MDFTSVDWPQVWAAVIGIGVGAKGIKDYLSKGKDLGRGCLYGDEAHEELRKLLMEISRSLNTHSAQSTETHDMVLWIKAITEERK